MNAVFRCPRDVVLKFGFRRGVVHAGDEIVLGHETFGKLVHLLVVEAVLVLVDPARVLEGLDAAFHANG